jgi:pimeloyl-ACP methyl ester carboxylesterase
MGTTIREAWLIRDGHGARSYGQEILYRRMLQPSSFPALCRLKSAPAERASVFFTKATDRRCSFCMDIPRLTWHKVAPRLAERFSVYVPDLRGYGDSSRPSDGDRHLNYSFRAMALDQIETMRHFGHEQFLVGAHDRGARVAHRLCLDFPKSVKKVCLMDIAPTLTMYRQTKQEFATKYMWWFFLIQRHPCQSISLDSILSTIWNITLAC